MAAVLAGGEGAVLSRRAAGAHWGIRQMSHGLIEVTVAARTRSRPSLRFHRARLPADEVTVHRGIPITTVPRTIFDLAAVDPRRQVERAIHEAEVLRLWDPLSLNDLIERHPHRRGAATLGAIQADAGRGSTVTKEEIEYLFIALLERAGLPLPRMNQIIRARGRTFEADCVWFDQQVIVELDGYAVHGTRRNYESDRERDRILAAHHWITVRVTWRQLQDDPEQVMTDLAVLLGS